MIKKLEVMYQFNRCPDQSTVRCSGNTDELQFIFTFGQNTTLQKKMKAKKKKEKENEKRVFAVT